MVIVKHYNLILNWMMLMMMMTTSNIQNKGTVWGKEKAAWSSCSTINWISLTIFLMILNLEMHRYQLYGFGYLEGFYREKINKKQYIYIYQSLKYVYTKLSNSQAFQIKDNTSTWPRFSLSSRLLSTCMSWTWTCSNLSCFSYSRYETSDFEISFFFVLLRRSLKIDVLLFVCIQLETYKSLLNV
jgi:hypothetical protein